MNDEGPSSEALAIATHKDTILAVFDSIPPRSYPRNPSYKNQQLGLLIQLQTGSRASDMFASKDRPSHGSERRPQLSGSGNLIG